MIKKKAQKASCISRTILCSPASLNWFPPSQISEQYSCCVVLFLFIYLLALDMTKIFHSCSVYWISAHLLFLNIPLASTTSCKRLPAFMGIIFLWSITKRGALGLPPSLLSLTFNPPARKHVSNSVLLMKVCFSSLQNPLFCVPQLKKICTEL